MKKGLNFSKQQLQELYLDKKLSLSQIGERFGCEGTNILYWLKKYDIKRRGAFFRKVDIPKKILEDLYINKRLSSLQIAKKLNLVNHRTIRKKLNQFGIKTRSLSEAARKKFRRSFSGDLAEKAFLLGLRAGDFYARKKNCSVRIQTSTTHLAQIGLLGRSFFEYGKICKYLFKSKIREDEWFIYVDLDDSFDFLVKKPDKIPDWCLNNDNYFYNFLAAYMDCEGNWHLSKSHEIHARYTFRLRTGDKRILEDMKNKLIDLGYSCILSLDTKKGLRGPYAPFNFHIYNLHINKKKYVSRLISNILHLSKHTEKIRKMKLMSEYKDKSYQEIFQKWLELKNKIKKEILKNQ